MFSLAWAALGAVYYFLVHPRILGALNWLANNLAFSFVIGMFYGVFIIDLAHSLRLVARLKQFAQENDVVIRYENLKAHIRSMQEKRAGKYRFFRPFASDVPLSEHLRDRLREMRDEVKEGRDTVFSRIPSHKK